MLNKLLLSFIVLFNYYVSYGQKTVDHYYDYNWKICAADEARFYSLEEHTDSGWHRNDIYVNSKKLQMAGLYEDKEATISIFHGLITAIHLQQENIRSLINGRVSGNTFIKTVG